MTDPDIIDEIEALSLHYPQGHKTGAERRRVMEDYASDLDGVDIATLRAACASWRRSDASRFPTSGQLLKTIEAVRPRAGEKIGGWMPISDEEYQSLPVRDKIRHHMILAAESDRKAGPMWAAGRPVPLEDMPPAYHVHRAQAAHHKAEAQRLRGIITTARDGAGA